MSSLIANSTIDASNLLLQELGLNNETELEEIKNKLESKASLSDTNQFLGANFVPAIDMEQIPDGENVLAGADSIRRYINLKVQDVSVTLPEGSEFTNAPDVSVNDEPVESNKIVNVNSLRSYLSSSLEDYAKKTDLDFYIKTDGNNKFTGTNDFSGITTVPDTNLDDATDYSKVSVNAGSLKRYIRTVLESHVPSNGSGGVDGLPFDPSQDIEFTGNTTVNDADILNTSEASKLTANVGSIKRYVNERLSSYTPIDKSFDPASNIDFSGTVTIPDNNELLDLSEFSKLSINAGTVIRYVNDKLKDYSPSTQGFDPSQDIEFTGNISTRDVDFSQTDDYSKLSVNAGSIKRYIETRLDSYTPTTDSGLPFDPSQDISFTGNVTFNDVDFSTVTNGSKLPATIGAVKRYIDSVSMGGVVIGDGSGETNTQVVVANSSYVHAQATESTIWDIYHEYNTTNFIISTYNSSNKVINGQIELIDENHIKVKFTQAVTGKAVLLFGANKAANIDEITGCNLTDEKVTLSGINNFVGESFFNHCDIATECGNSRKVATVGSVKEFVTNTITEACQNGCGNSENTSALPENIAIINEDNNFTGKNAFVGTVDIATQDADSTVAINAGDVKRYITDLVGTDALPKIARYYFNEPSLEWKVIHNKNTTFFSEVIRTSDFTRVFATVTVNDLNSFTVHLTMPLSGFVDVHF